MNENENNNTLINNDDYNNDAIVDNETFEADEVLEASVNDEPESASSDDISEAVTDDSTADMSFNADEDSTAEKEEENTKAKKPYSYRKSIAVALAGTICCGASLGFTLGLGLNLSNNILNSVSKIGRANFSFSSNADSNAITASTNIVTSNDDIVKVIEAVKDSVVNVNIKATTSDIFNRQYESSGSGSGIIYKEDDKKVYILTNSHVVETATSCTISITGDEQVKASLVGKDTTSDVAVISVLKSDLSAAGIDSVTVAQLGNSDNVQVGETVIAIGNALGQGKTTTQGIVSTTNKEVNIDGKQYNAIQTDAAINPGNSGGALVDTEGKIIGINSAKTASTTVEGTGYAIPINHAVEIATQLMENGTIEKGYLGVSTYTINDQFKRMYQIDIDGVFITSVESDSPAEEAGLQQTDIITAIDNTKVTTAEELSEIITSHKPGDTATLTVIRNGSQSMQVKVTFTNLSQGF
jgi:serine protease Do